MAIKRTSLENYVLLLDLFQRMRFVAFKPKTFLKKIRPYCKTENINDRCLYVRIRGSKIGIRVEISKDSFLITQTGCLHEFIFYCETSKVTSKLLLSKLLKHNLLTP